MYLKFFLSIVFIVMFWLALPIIGNAMPEGRISIDFVDIKVCDLLKTLAGYANKSIVVSEKINGKVTIDLRNVYWREALDTVLKMHGLIKYETQNVIIIMTQDELGKNEQALLRPVIFNLHHVSADNVSKILKPAGVLSALGKSGVASGSNSLVIADTSDRIAIIKELLKQVDIPAKQVLIEARIVNADESFLQELGLELHSAKINGSQGGSPLTVLHGGQFNFVLAKFGDSGLLDLQLAALENEGRGKIISKPKLLAADRQPAYIEAGAEIPYQEKTKSGNTTVAFKKAVLSLKVTPEVVAKDAINLSLELNQDKVGQLMINGVPTIDTRKIQTQVLVHNNETMVLGGIYEWSKVNHVTSVPFFGQIPLIKIFFSKKGTRMERKELLIFVTPRIVS